MAAGRDDVAPGMIPPRRMRRSVASHGGTRGAVGSRRGGAAIVGAIATPTRAPRARAGQAVGMLPALCATSRSGGTSGRRGSGPAARHPAGARTARIAVDVPHP